MEAELFREINGRFLLNSVIPLFVFLLFKGIRLYMIYSNLKYPAELIHHYSQILGVSLEPCRRSICLLFQSSLVVTGILRLFTVTLFFYHKNNAYISLLVITLLK